MRITRHTFDDNVAAFAFSSDGRRLGVAAGDRLHVMEGWRSTRPITVLDETVKNGTFAVPTFDGQGQRLAAACARVDDDPESPWSVKCSCAVR